MVYGAETAYRAVACLCIGVATVGYGFAAEPAADLPSTEPKLVSNEVVEQLLEPILRENQVPGIVAGIVEHGELSLAGAVGLRKIGSPERMTVGDQLHLGSNTKAMTATLLALLIEQHKLSWDTTIEDVFSKLMPPLHPDFRDVTLLQLLNHRGGVPANGPWRMLGKGTVVAQRETLLKKMMGKEPDHRPGETMLYSNVGYVIAGHMAEQVIGESWETLMTEKLFQPLKMTSAGFGIPGTRNQVDQPWGHVVQFGKVTALQIDNDPALGPAGTVHCTLADWSRFVSLHLEGARGHSTFLSPDSFKVLQTPPSGSDYACGWIVTERPWGKGRVLTHSGSNTTWYATAWMAPAIDAAFICVTNQGGEPGRKACDQSVSALIQYHAKMSKRASP